jgi:hypothetical protein
MWRKRAIAPTGTEEQQSPLINKYGGHVSGYFPPLKQPVAFLLASPCSDTPPRRKQEEGTLIPVFRNLATRAKEPCSPRCHIRHTEGNMTRGLSCTNQSIVLTHGQPAEAKICVLVKRRIDRSRGALRLVIDGEGCRSVHTMPKEEKHQMARIARRSTQLVSAVSPQPRR